MKRILLAAILCVCTSLLGFAQQTASDASATKEDIQQYFKVMHSREMMLQMMDAMVKPMHQMLHEQFQKDKDKLPPDFEARMNKIMDDSMKAIHVDEIMDSMVPVYQKHFTKGDISALTAFYSSRTGQKILREMPAIMGEATQSMMPMMRKQMDTLREHMQQEVAQMLKDSDGAAADKSQATPK